MACPGLTTAKQTLKMDAPLGKDMTSSDTDLTLAADFPEASHDQWLKLVDKVLGGAPFDKKLVSRTYDGINLQPLYTRGDWKAEGDPSGLPGGAPYTRGGNLLGGVVDGWDMRQVQDHPDPKTANKQILEDLERGVSSIVLRLDPRGEKGVQVITLADLETVLDGVYLDLAPVILDPHGPRLPYAALMMNVLAKRGVKPDAFKGNFGIDPLSVIASGKQIVASLENAFIRLSDGVGYMAQNYPNARAIDLKTIVYHSAGASDAQELGCAMASAVEYLRALTSGGIDIDTACKQIAFSIAVDADFFMAIAKVRALRKLWGRVAEACGAKTDNRVAPVTAYTAPRMMSRRDPWVNILRTTVSCFAAGVAGADAVTVLSFDSALGLPSDLGRRIARNTQVVLQEESGLARVIDPAGGAWMFESLTDELSEKAWAFFQEIEKNGGMIKALTEGFVAGRIAEVHAERSKNIAKRKDPITGVSEFPNLHEKSAKVQARAPKKFEGKSDASVKLPEPKDGGVMEALVKAVEGGADMTGLIEAFTAGTPVSMTPLPVVRIAESFESLRDAGDAFKEEYGQYPKIFLANIGRVAEFTARATFTKNFFEAGGIEAVAGAGGADAATIAEDFKKSGASFAAICSSDAVYAEHAVNVATALKDAGAGAIYLAGKPGDLEGSLKDAGVVEFIFIGCNAQSILADAHTRLAAG